MVKIIFPILLVATALSRYMAVAAPITHQNSNAAMVFNELGCEKLDGNGQLIHTDMSYAVITSSGMMGSISWLEAMADADLWTHVRKTSTSSVVQMFRRLRVAMLSSSEVAVASTWRASMPAPRMAT